MALLIAAGAGACRSEDKLAGSVEIIRDTFGVPHIYAPTDAGVLFGAAWAQAEDNWWQVEDNFVHALGRASELYGEESFLSDYLARAMEIRRLSIEEYEGAPEEMRALCDAYAAGFNLWLERHPGAERRLLERVEPWHTLALIRFKYHHNEFIGYAGLRQRGTELLLEMPDYGLAGESPKGSNQVAVSGSRTASGHPMLLINPHVPFFGRGQYWEVHLASEEGLEFSGLSRFGFLLPYMGNGDFMGWAYTDNASDIGDLYREHFDDPEHPLRYRYGDGWREATEWRETITVREDGKLEAREVRLRRTHHGPVLGAVEEEGGIPVPVAVRLARLEEGGWFEQWYRMMRSRSLEEFRSAVAMLRVSYMNTLYADRDGNIWYVYSAAIPRRSEKYDWRLPVDGSDPGTEWRGYHALEELPQVLNPESGFLQNCNSTPLEATTGLDWQREEFPPYLVGRERQNARAVRATRILEGLSGVTLDEFSEAMLDTHLVASETMLPELIAEFVRLRDADPERGETLRDAIDLFRQWDREVTLDSEAATLFVHWAEALNRSGGKQGEWLCIAALEEAMAELEEDWGSWRVAWGEINRAQRPDASGRVPFSDELASTPVPGAPGWLGSIFTYSSRPGPGTRRRYGTHGNSFVKVVEFGAEPEGRSVLVFGESGDPASPHYLDQVEIYAAKGFKPAWFRREEVEANAERRYRLVPDE